jgi:hypothetical protein
MDGGMSGRKVGSIVFNLVIIIAVVAALSLVSWEVAIIGFGLGKAAL